MNEQLAPARRMKFIMVRPADFLSLFKKGLKVHTGFKITKGVPADAVALTIVYESRMDAFLILVQSAEYDEVAANVMPPIEPVEIIVGRKK